MAFKKQKTILIFCLLLAFSLPLFAHAKSGLVPCGGNGQSPCTVEDIFSLIAKVTNWLIAVAGLYAVFQIVSAGFYLVVSMGNEESITKQKSALSSAVVGFVFVMMAYILINQAVNHILLDNAPCNLKVDIVHPFSYLTGSTPCPK